MFQEENRRKPSDRLRNHAGLRIGRVDTDDGSVRDGSIQLIPTPTAETFGENAAPAVFAFGINLGDGRSPQACADMTRARKDQQLDDL
jgi:hypothetical protein